MSAQRVRQRVMIILVGLVVVSGLTGCTGEEFCLNPILASIFCRPDASTASQAPPPDYTVPAAPTSSAPPSARIDVSDTLVTKAETVEFDGSWSDSDGKVVKFEWDLNGDGTYEAHGVPTPTNRDHRSRTFSEFRTYTIRLRVIDNDGYTDVDEVRVTVQPRRPTAALAVTPAGPSAGQDVTFDASGSTSLDTPITGYVWDLDGIVGNGYEVHTTEPRAMHTYTAAQTIQVGVRALTYIGGYYGEARQSLTIGSGPRSLSIARAPTAPAAARPFSASLNARPVAGQPGRFQLRGAVQSLRGALVTGRFNGRLAQSRSTSPADALMTALLHSGYRARLDATADARTGKRTATMLALAKVPRGSACLRISLVERPGRKPSGSFRVLGGTGSASRLGATGSFGFKPGPNTPSALNGSVKTKLVKARGLPRACAALR